MKKLLCLLLAALLVLSLAACAQVHPLPVPGVDPEAGTDTQTEHADTGEPADGTDDPEPSDDPGESAQEPDALSQLTELPAGTWQVDAEATMHYFPDQPDLYTLFGSSLRDYGGMLTVWEDGSVSFWLGANSPMRGTAEFAGSGIFLADMVPDYEEGGEAAQVTLYVLDYYGEPRLVTAWDDIAVVWAPGDDGIPADGEGELGNWYPGDLNQAWLTYGGLLDLYSMALEEGWDMEGMGANGLPFILGYYTNGFYETDVPAADAIGYCFLDLDADGSSELLIGPVGSSLIYAMYCQVDGEPVQLFEGWDRNSYELTGIGDILNTGSGGAALTSTTTWYYWDGGFYFGEGYLWDYETDEENPCFYLTEPVWSGTDPGATPVATDEADQWVARYVNLIWVPEYTPFSA